MKVLVTGGAGFIGSHLVDCLINQGYQVAVVDNLATGFREYLNSAAKFYEMSIGDACLSEVFEAEKPDVVNHHAAQILVSKSVEDPVFDAKENILGSLNMISNACHFKVKRFIYASTGGAIYGDMNSSPVDENQPVNPISHYGVSKHAVEHYLYLYAHLYGLPFVVLRYANVYGPRQNPQGEAGVVAIFARQMLQGERPTIFGPGDKTRDYVYVSDVVEANLLAMGKGENSIYNIGTGIETSDQQIFDMIARALDFKAPPFYAPLHKGEVYRISLDSSKARRELGWSPQISLEEGIARTVNYYRCLR